MGGSLETGLALVLGAMCLVMLAVAMLRRAQQRPARARELTREQLARLRDQQQMQRTMEELLLQLEDVSRRINAQTDASFSRLEQLVQTADERIARLDSLLHPHADLRRRTPAARGPSPDPRSAPALNAPAAASAGPAAPAQERASPPRTKPLLNVATSAAPAVPPLIPAAAPPPQPRAADATRPETVANEPPPASSRAQRRQRIYELADGGAAPMTIADLLQIPLGEVELLLNVRGYLQAQRAEA